MIHIAQDSPGVRRRIVALLGSLRAARLLTNRSCGFWSGDGGSHREAPGELAVTGSHGKNRVGQDQKVELMYRFDVDQQKTR